MRSNEMLLPRFFSGLLIPCVYRMMPRTSGAGHWLVPVLWQACVADQYFLHETKLCRGSTKHSHDTIINRYAGAKVPGAMITG